MKKNGQTSLSTKYWLLILSLVCVVLMGLSVVSDKINGPLRSVANYSIIPMQKGINTLGVWMNDLTRNFETLEELREENKELQAQIADLTTKNNLLQQEKHEMDRLRELFELDQKYGDYPKVGARVTANDTGNWFSSFVIDKGANDGIEVDMNVMAGTGLVGIIS